MNYIPKESHPWKRSYKTNLTREQQEKLEKRKMKIKPVRVLVEEILESWETIEVFSLGDDRKNMLMNLTQEKQAAWLAGLLRRSYQ